jgi:hypothetical protein
MEFFAELPPVPPMERPTPPPVPEWMNAPANQIPVAMPMARRVARAPGVALHLRRLDVYRTGVVIELQLDLRREPGLDLERGTMIGELLHPRGYRPGPAGQLRLGVTLADGTRASADGDFRGHPWSLQEPPQVPYLAIVGGGGGGDEDHWSSEARAWLWPLPPAGPLRLHYRFDGVGLEEGSVELDAAPIRAASAGVIDVWAE